MPSITPKLKIHSARNFGGEWLDIVLTWKTFDDGVLETNKFQKKKDAIFTHAFDNLNAIEG